MKSIGARELRTFLALLICVSPAIRSQAAIITQWNFNSNPADANTATGTTAPSTGAGTALLVGGTTATFASGDANGGSTDPAVGDDSGWGTTTYPAATVGDKTAGVQFLAGTAGYQGITVSFDLRHSNTSSRYEQLQYTLNGSTWIDAQVFQGAAGDTWFNRAFDLSGIPAANNNGSFGIRVVSTFDPNAPTTYVATNAASTYGTGGTWRFDMVTINGTLLPVGNDTDIDLSPTAVDFGRIMQNAPLPASTAVAVNENPAGTSTSTNYSLGANTLNPQVTLSNTAGDIATNGGSGAPPIGVALNSTATTGSLASSFTISNVGNPTDTDSQTVDITGAIVSQRVVTGTNVDLGRVMVGQSVTGLSNLSTNGSTNERTNINVATTGGPNGDGLSVIAGTDSDSNLPTNYDDGTDVGNRMISGAFGTPGAKIGSVGLAVTPEGLTNEGAYADVAVPYTASALADRDIQNATVNLDNVIKGTALSGSVNVADDGVADTAATRTVINPGTVSNSGLDVTVPAAAHTFNGANGAKSVDYDIPAGFTAAGGSQSKSVNLAGQLSSGEFSAAALTAGGVAVIGFIDNGTPDSAAFVPLQPLSPGQTIYFTTNGWSNSSAPAGYRGAAGTLDGDGNEDLLKFTAVNAIPAGTIIRTSDVSADFTWTNTGPVPGGTSGSFGDLALGQGGDQISAFTGPLNLPMQSPSNLYQLDDTNGFEDATSTATSNVQSGLTNGVSANTFDFASANFAAVTGALLTGSNTKAGWLATFTNAANWTTGGSGTLPTGNITISDAPSAFGLLPGQTLDGTVNVTVNANVFDASNASFDAASNVDDLIIPIGSFVQGSGSHDVSALIANLLSDPNFTATLDLDTIAGIGATGVLFTDLINNEFDDLTGGATYAFLATLDANNSPGIYAAQYTISLSDGDDFLGATSQTLQLTLTGEITPIPEPSGLLLAGLGLIGLVGGCRRLRAV